jgi:hypothetical protein
MQRDNMQREKAQVMPATEQSNNNYSYSEPEILPSRVKRMMEDFTAQIELKAARVAGGMSPADEIEQVFQQALETAKAANPQRAEEAQRRMARPLTLVKQEPRFARFADVDLQTPGAVDKINVGKAHRAAGSYFNERWVHIPPKVDGVLETDLVVPQAGYTGLKFYITKVKCVEETDGFGSDEIYLGVNCVDETGDTSYKYAKVSDDFDTGEVVDYGFPGKEFQYFNLKEGGDKFPKIYTVGVAMVEEDVGNMSGWFKDLHEKIHAAIKQMLKEAGYALGELIGLGDLGALIGSIVAGIIKWLADWLFAIFSNDYMGTFMTKAVINSYTGNWTATGTRFFSWSKKHIAHGGHYHTWYTWELVK